MSIMYGLIYFRIEMNQEGIQNVNSLLFLSVLYVSVIHVFMEVKVSQFLCLNYIIEVTLLKVL
jgi:hypothetical protein